MTHPFLLQVALFLTGILQFAVAQDAATLQTILSDLHSLGATKMAALIQGSSTFAGPLTASTPRTLFVPVDAAFGSADTSDMDALLLYHLVTDGEWTADRLGTIANHSILTTALTGHRRTFLENNRPAVIAAGRPHGDNAIEVYNQQAQTLVSQTKQNTQLNILYYVINRAIDWPVNFPGAASLLTPQFQMTAGLAGYSDDVIGAMQGYTFFAFQDSGFQADSAHLSNESSLDIFNNHVILNKTMYYPDFLSQTWTTASGNQLSFTVGNTTSFEMSVSIGQSSAAIIRSDLTIDNGVIHILDHTLWDLHPVSNTTSTSNTASPSQPFIASETVFVTATGDTAVPTSGASSLNSLSGGTITGMVVALMALLLA